MGSGQLPQDPPHVSPPHSRPVQSGVHVEPASDESIMHVLDWQLSPASQPLPHAPQ